MARPSLADLKKLIKEQEQKSKGGFFNGDEYPFWNMKDQEESIIRILPDQDEENPRIFYVEFFEHKIHINGDMRTIPCSSNYGEECPICERSVKYYKIARELKEETKDFNNLGPNAKKGSYYYKKKSALLKALVVKDPLPESPETGKNSQGTIKTVKFSTQVLNALNSSLAGFEDNDEPWDLIKGYDFIIRKGKQGSQASYTGSSFSRKSTAVSAEILEVLELTDLTTLKTKNPGIENIAAKLEAHDNGTDVPDESSSKNEKSSQKPSQKESVKESVKEKEKVADPTPEKKEEPVKEPTPAPADDGDDDILAKIRNRNKAKK